MSRLGMLSVLLVMVVAILAVLLLAPAAGAQNRSCHAVSGYNARSSYHYAPSYPSSYAPTYSSYSPSYAPASYTPTYSTGYHYADVKYDYKEVLVPYAVKAYVSPDYYFSTQDYYRDKLLVDAMAGRLLDLQQRGVLGGMGGGGGGGGSGGGYGGAAGAGNGAGNGTAPLVAPPAAPAVAPSVMQPAVNGGGNGGGAGTGNGGYVAPTDYGRPPSGLKEVTDSKCVRCHDGSKHSDLRNLNAVPPGKRWECYGRVNANDMPKGGQPCNNTEAELFYNWAILAGTPGPPGPAPRAPAGS